MRRRGTRAGSISIYCAHEALKDSGLSLESLVKDRTGIYLGITEHGNVETENEIYELHQNNLDAGLWSHHHNPRTVANTPAGEVSLNTGITGPAYTIGAACAAGNIGVIHGMQMLQLGEIDLALAGGVSESTGTFGIFAGFKSQGALGSHEDPTKASRPLDINRNGIVVSEGGAVFVLERLEDALQRGAKIYGEIAGYHVNSDAVDFVLPDTQRQIQCINTAMAKANISPAILISLICTPPEQCPEMKTSVKRSGRFSDNPITPTSIAQKALSGMPWAPPALWNWQEICRASPITKFIRVNILRMSIRSVT